MSNPASSGFDVRRAVESGLVDSFVHAYRQAISEGDFDAVRVGLPTLRSLPRADSLPLIRQLREVWPDLAPVNHPSYAEDAQAELGPSGLLQGILRRAIDGDREGALREVRRRETKWAAVLGDAAHVRALVDAMPARADLPRPLLRDHGEDVLVGPPGERGLCVVFCGLSDRATFDLPVFDALLARAGYGGIYLRDHGRSLFLDGVPGIAGGRAGLAEWLRVAVGRANGETIFLGSSVGGIGAMDWGCELGIARVLAFASPVTTRPERMDALGETRCRILQRSLDANGNAFDLDARIVASGHTGTIDLFFGEKMAIDRAHAESVAAAQVRRNCVPGFAGHQVLLPITWRGLFTGVLSGDSAALAAVSSQ